MGRRFITAHDIDDLVADGGRELRLDAGTRLTDLARERARDRGIAIVESGTTTVGAATRATAPTPTPAAAPASTASTRTSEANRPRDREAGARPASSSGRGEEGTPRRQLRAAVRAGVVQEFGGAPEGLDAAIGRVFDRLGIRD
jgi:pyruvate/2-oxoglutarate dehydrogenase complex dihydrolipoamide acyltransferase (E2) component